MGDIEQLLYTIVNNLTLVQNIIFMTNFFKYFVLFREVNLLLWLLLLEIELSTRVQISN